MTLAREFPHQNLLKEEKSPYLLQHADNPVHWYPWGELAFERAAAEDKPVFLSIGYSTCHWCHVMAHESFESEGVACLLNAHFVAIKVDREERPDIDGIYMKAVMAVTGSGGWPLSVFLTPQKIPFWGGTYFPSEARWGQPGFKQILLSIHESWQTRRAELEHSADVILKHLQEMSVSSGAVAAPSLDARVLAQAYERLANRFDANYGGFGQAPKFPSGHGVSFLLRYWKRTGNPQALLMAEKTLQEMARGGLRDHLGGGFHRYSTDERWFLPHFEKMLYDQAVLARAYLEAYQVTQNEVYAQVARSVFDYVLRMMTDPHGGFLSAEDADSLPPESAADPAAHKVEGAFYLWHREELAALLEPEEMAVFCFYYGVEAAGNVVVDPHGEFGKKNHLFAAHTLAETAQQCQVSVETAKGLLKAAVQKALQHRGQRPQPHLDDKILTDWNALMISAFSFGGGVLAEPRYVQAAQKAMDFLLRELVDESGQLCHRYRDGEAAIRGQLDDYAFFLQALLDLYEETFEEKYIERAIFFASEMVKLFWDAAGFGFFSASHEARDLFLREKELYDGAMPSGNSIAALSLLRLSRLTLQDPWKEKASEILEGFSLKILTVPEGYLAALSALDFLLGPVREIVLVSPDKKERLNAFRQIVQRNFLPNKVMCGFWQETPESQPPSAFLPLLNSRVALSGEVTAYVCQNNQCQLPTIDLKEFEARLREETNS